MTTVICPVKKGDYIADGKRMVEVIDIPTNLDNSQVEHYLLVEDCVTAGYFSIALREVGRTWYPVKRKS